MLIADNQVEKLYKKILEYLKIKKNTTKIHYIIPFINKNQIIKAILNNDNIKKDC